MLRYIAIALVTLVFVAGIGFRMMVSTDPGTTHLDKKADSDTLVVLIHGLPGPDSLGALKRVIREEFPRSDLLTATYSPSLLSNTDPYRITNTIEHGIADAHHAKNYDRIVLIGHSLGAILLRKALVWGYGVEEDRQHLGALGRRNWPDKVTRFVSLAGINRGWSLDPRPEHMGYQTYALAQIGEWVATLTGTGKLLYEVKRGAPFISDLRVQWIRIARQGLPSGEKLKLPLSIHLIGDTDDVVTLADSQDLAATKDARFIMLLNTKHVDIITELDRGTDASERLKAIRAALSRPEAELPFSKLEVRDEDHSIKRIIYILHGIRDYGVWAEQLRSEIDKRKGPDVAVTPAKYGYFPMMPFVIFSDRQKNVRRFMDEYTENLAKFPYATQLDFIGHSNGTYILASALQRYQTLHVNNVFFAGSVVPRTYPWRELIDSGRVDRVHNAVATKDWVVALLPRFFEQMAEWLGVTSVKGVFDIGSAGFRGFDDSGKPDPKQRLFDAKYVEGTHGSALDLREARKMSAVVQFAVDGRDDELRALATGKEVDPWLDTWSNLSWVVWLGMAVVLLGLGYVAALLFGKIGVAGYAMILAALLYSF